jgi:hypothetical protein
MGLAGLFQPPVTVRIIDPNTDPTGLGDVLLRSLGLTGVLALLALVAGVVFAAVLFWIRSRSTDY